MDIHRLLNSDCSIRTDPFPFPFPPHVTSTSTQAERNADHGTGDHGLVIGKRTHAQMVADVPLATAVVATAVEEQGPAKRPRITEHSETSASAFAARNGARLTTAIAPVVTLMPALVPVHTPSPTAVIAGSRTLRDEQFCPPPLPILDTQLNLQSWMHTRGGMSGAQARHAGTVAATQRSGSGSASDSAANRWKALAPLIDTFLDACRKFKTPEEFEDYVAALQIATLYIDELRRAGADCQAKRLIVNGMYNLGQRCGSIASSRLAKIPCPYVPAIRNALFGDMKAAVPAQHALSARFIRLLIETGKEQFDDPSLAEDCRARLSTAMKRLPMRRHMKWAEAQLAKGRYAETGCEELATAYLDRGGRSKLVKVILANLPLPFRMNAAVPMDGAGSVSALAHVRSAGNSEPGPTMQDTASASTSGNAHDAQAGAPAVRLRPEMGLSPQEEAKTMRPRIEHIPGMPVIATTPDAVRNDALYHFIQQKLHSGRATFAQANPDSDPGLSS